MPKQSAVGKARRFQDLVKHVHDLPPELFNNIRDMVFYVPPRRRIATTKTKCPGQLNVDRATRAKFAKYYYGNGAGSSFRSGEKGVLTKWLVFLPPEHRAHLGQHSVRYRTKDEDVISNPTSRLELSFAFRLSYGQDIELSIIPTLERAGVVLEDDVLQVCSTGCLSDNSIAAKFVKKKDFLEAKQRREDAERAGSGDESSDSEEDDTNDEDDRDSGEDESDDHDEDE